MMLRHVSANRVHPAIHQSEVVVAGTFAFTSATLADDGATGISPEARNHPAYPYLASEVKLQARHLFAKLGRALEATGTSLEHVVKGHVFLTDFADLTAFDEIWREVFPRPITKTTVGAGELLVAGARVSVDVIACMPGSAIEVRGVNAGSPPPFTAKVEAIRAGDLIFTAGQLAHDGRTGVARGARSPKARSISPIPRSPVGSRPPGTARSRRRPRAPRWQLAC